MNKKLITHFYHYRDTFLMLLLFEYILEWHYRAGNWTDTGAGANFSSITLLRMSLENCSPPWTAGRWWAPPASRGGQSRSPWWCPGPGRGRTWAAPCSGYWSPPWPTPGGSAPVPRTLPQFPVRYWTFFSIGEKPRWAKKRRQNPPNLKRWQKKLPTTLIKLKGTGTGTA